VERYKQSKGYAVAVGGVKGVVRILVYVLISLIIVYLGKTAYGLGYEVFNQKPLDNPENAQSISVTITEDMSVMKIGELLQEKGLVEKPLVFWMQEKVSDYRGEIQAGTYTLTTAMPVDEMLAVMARADVEEEEDS
jgi:Predicted periplasmic solute-binding protein